MIVFIILINESINLVCIWGNNEACHFTGLQWRPNITFLFCPTWWLCSHFFSWFSVCEGFTLCALWSCKVSYNLSITTCLFPVRDPPPENIHISSLPPSIPTEQEPEHTEGQGDDDWLFVSVVEVAPLTLKHHALLFPLKPGQTVHYITNCHSVYLDPSF